MFCDLRREGRRQRRPGMKIFIVLSSTDSQVCVKSTEMNGWIEEGGLDMGEGGGGEDRRRVHDPSSSSLTPDQYSLNHGKAPTSLCFFLTCSRALCLIQLLPLSSSFPLCQCLWPSLTSFLPNRWTGCDPSSYMGFWRLILMSMLLHWSCRWLVLYYWHSKSSNHFSVESSVFGTRFCTHHHWDGFWSSMGCNWNLQFCRLALLRLLRKIIIFTPHYSPRHIWFLLKAS